VGRIPAIRRHIANPGGSFVCRRIAAPNTRGNHQQSVSWMSVSCSIACRASGSAPTRSGRLSATHQRYQSLTGDIAFDATSPPGRIGGACSLSLPCSLAG
jgi:hypothetical protein